MLREFLVHFSLFIIYSVLVMLPFTLSSPHPRTLKSPPDGQSKQVALCVSSM